MDNRFKLIADTLGKDKVKLDEPMVEYTTLNVGGPAKLFFIAFTQKEIIKVAEMTRELKIPLFIFGTGSKMMLSDRGFDGVVVKNRTSNIQIVGVRGKVSKGGVGVDEALVEVESGLSINKLVEFLDAHGLRIVEINGLPGSVGGNLFINKHLQEKTQSIRVIEDGGVEEIKVEDLNLRKHIILSAVFKFKAKEG